MAGPVSLPTGPKGRWEELNEIVCNNHFHCTMQEYDEDGNELHHDYVSYRIWLMRRGRLTTGKTV